MAPSQTISHVSRLPSSLRPWLPIWVATPASLAILATVRAS